MPGNMLIAYYSWGGSTRRLSEQIHASTEDGLFEIIPQMAYPKDYNTCTAQAKKEIHAGHKPALKSKLEHIERFTIILLGSPNWWSSIAPPVSAFLSEYVEFIKRMRDAGVPVDPLIDYVALFQEGDNTRDARKMILVEQRDNLVNRAAELQKLITRLDYKIEHYYDKIVQAEQSLSNGGMLDPYENE
ncbi:hypothetical protein Holit_01039 [Hollandina sp. SP2]